MFNVVSGPKFDKDPNSVILVTVPSRVYWNAIVGARIEVAGNVEWDGGNSLADRE